MAKLKVFCRTGFSRLVLLTVLTLAAGLIFAALAFADVPGRNRVPGGAVPNPGTQEHDLANITFPSPYNVFEFPVTCGACHGGTIDQQAGHYGNWAGTNMASAARDPIFRANSIIVNNAVKAATGKDGAGNMCWRCHSPNAWHSGRMNPDLAGKGDGSLLIQDPLLSTDAEGILCEMCHRTIGAVKMEQVPGDPAFNMMKGLDDWPHLGNDYPQGPLPGNPLGDATLQINDGMTYGGKYAGSVDLFWSDVPIPGTGYTGQTYGVYPPGWKNVLGNDIGGQPVINPDGSTPIHFEVPIGPPLIPGSSPPRYDYDKQAVSLEHPTFKGDFIRSSEFCGACHDLTVPVLNHGMPEQRTYTEWKYSDFGRDETAATYKECQECHMPTLKHEYSDDAPVSINPDPVVSGWFPYAKDRNPNGGTSFHKLTGANRDLPQMMKLLYPEVDIVIAGGQPTGRDTRAFPGLMSSRDLTWDRASRNTEVTLHDAADIQIISGPAYQPAVGKWEVKVKVINKSGHRIPSGYPDGRRAWINLEVRDSNGRLIYESGHYDKNTARLTTTGSTTNLNYALEPVITDNKNAVMIYEKRTGVKNPDGTYTPSLNLLNDKILFDNRLPPAGYSKTDYSRAGTKFINHHPVTYAPYEDTDRYPDGVNYDIVTYRFSAPRNAVLKAKATFNWQTHTREFMEHLKDNDKSTLRPEGPPSVWEINYPLTPNYLSDTLAKTTGRPWSSFRDLSGRPLRDNWGGIAYAAWLLTGKGEPFAAASDDSAVTGAPAAPTGLSASLVDPFAIRLRWNPVRNADGYIIWIRYGKDEATASWDKLAVVYGKNEFVNDGLNVAKTYAYKVEAFNGKGSSASAAIKQTTPTDLPLEPINLIVVPPTTAKSVKLAWYDQADNELGFVIERQDVPATAPFKEIARIPTPNNGGFGGVNWTDTTVQPNRTYNYRIAAYNASGMSVYSNLVSAITIPGVPVAPTGLTAAAVSAGQVDLQWADNADNEKGYKVERKDGVNGTYRQIATLGANITSYSDKNTKALITYYYRVRAYNDKGNSAYTDEVMVSTPPNPPAAPSNLLAFSLTSSKVMLTWRDKSGNEDFFHIERAKAKKGPFVEVAKVGRNTPLYVDEKLTANTTYYYRVRASNEGGYSKYSNIVSVRTRRR